MVENSIVMSVSETRTQSRIGLTARLADDSCNDPEEALPLSSEVSTAEFLQCGEIISKNIQTAAIALGHLMELICVSLSDLSEADTIFPLLLKGRDLLDLTLGKAEAAVCSIKEALLSLCHCLDNYDSWSKLSTHLREFQEHTRQFHNLWPQNRNFLKQEFLPALSGRLYSPQNILPQTGLWVAQLTRSERMFPRLQAWGQLPNIVADICAAVDPIPGMLDKVEKYAKAVSERMQVVVLQSSHFRQEQSDAIMPGLWKTHKAWGKSWFRSREYMCTIRAEEPSRYLPSGLIYSRVQSTHYVKPLPSK